MSLWIKAGCSMDTGLMRVLAGVNSVITLKSQVWWKIWALFLLFNSVRFPQGHLWSKGWRERLIQGKMCVKYSRTGIQKFVFWTTERRHMKPNIRYMKRRFWGGYCKENKVDTGWVNTSTKGQIFTWSWQISSCGCLHRSKPWNIDFSHWFSFFVQSVRNSRSKNLTSCISVKADVENAEASKACTC